MAAKTASGSHLYSVGREGVAHKTVDGSLHLPVTHLASPGDVAYLDAQKKWKVGPIAGAGIPLAHNALSGRSSASAHPASAIDFSAIDTEKPLFVDALTNAVYARDLAVSEVAGMPFLVLSQTADATGVADAAPALQSLIDSAVPGTDIHAIGTFLLNSMITGKAGVTVYLPKGSIFNINHSGYSFRIPGGFSLVGEGIIKHLVATTLGSLWMRPTASVNYSVTNRPTIGDLTIQGVTDWDNPTGMGIHWDMTEGNGSYAYVGNATFRGWDVAYGFTVPSGQYITSVFNGKINVVYCRNGMYETGNLGQIAAFHFDAFHVQPYPNSVHPSPMLYGMRTDKGQYFTVDSLHCWDWDTKTDPAVVQEQVYLGVNTYGNVVNSQPGRSWAIVDTGVDNIIRSGVGTGGITPAIVREAHPQGGPEWPLFQGRQDDILPHANLRYAVTSTGVVGGYSDALLFNTRPEQYCLFTGDGTLKQVEIQFGSVIDVYAIGGCSPINQAPSQFKISVYSSGSWRLIYDSTSGATHHVAGTKLYRKSISAIRYEFLKSSNFQITELFAYSGYIPGKTFIQANGAVTMVEDLEFATQSAGKGVSFMDLTLGTRKRLYLDNGVMRLSGGGAIGYTVGDGGTVTQTTNKSTTVVLNKLNGEITTDAAALASQTSVTFQLTNSTVAAKDRLIVTHESGGTLGAYGIATKCFAGYAQVTIRNLSAGSLSEALVLGFTVFKGSAT